MNRKNLLQLDILTSSCEYEWKPMLAGDKVVFALLCYLYAILSWKNVRKNVFKNLT